MDEKVSRPPSVWVTQTLLVIFVLLFLSLLFDPLLLSTVPLKELVFKARFLIFVLVMFVLLAMLITAFWGLARRRIYGKWFGIVSLIFIWGLIIYTELFPPQGPYKRYEYNNAVQVAGAFLSLSLIHALFLILILRLAFSKKVNRFFQSKAKDVVA